ncbi:MAG: c-type cytochrome [Candidatus Sedimenticola sp. 20ELBAFRAG]
MSLKVISNVRTIAVAGVAALIVSGHALAEMRPEVVDRIKPVGKVFITGEEKAAAPAPAAETAAPAPAPVAEAAPAPAPEAAPAAPAGGDAQAIAQAKGCLACHQIEVKVVGPSYKDVAAKYKADADAVNTLVAKVQAGGVGTWGQIPMPPQAHVAEADIRAVVEWIMSM